MVAVALSKIVVVTINLIFLIFGLAALIVGIVFKVGWDDVRDAFINLSDDADFDLQSAGDILGYSGIIFGSFIVVVSLLGCIGACCKLRVLLVLYAIILIILIIAECAIVGVVATHADETEDAISKGLEKSLYNYYENSTNDVSRSYSALFDKLECCGVNNYSTSFPFEGGLQKGFNPALERPKVPRAIIPITCCRNFDYKAKLTGKVFDEQIKCLSNPESDNAYTEGCLPKVFDTIGDHKGILIGVGVAILVLELLMVIIAFFLCCREDKD